MKEIFEKINLQLFADAGNLVNATYGYVNAYNQDSKANTTAFDANNTLAGELKTFYDTELLENARIEMFYAQFAKKQPLPKNHGKTVEWRKWNTFAKAGQLQEGVIPTGQKFGMSSKTGAINQYGTYAAISDTLELRAYDDVILGATEEMGASAAETQETLIRDALLCNTNEMFCDNIDPATGAVASVPKTFAEMEASTSMSLLTPKMVARAVTKMKKDKVPTINGKYYAVVHPSVAHDLRNSDEWIEVHKYAATGEIFNGEIGELHGCRFIENVFAPCCYDTTTYKNKAGTAVYATHFFGKDGFGIIDPEGGALEMIIKSKEQVGGPLNQFSTVGYKFETNGATMLYPERVLCLWSCSSYSTDDKTNMVNFDKSYYPVTRT